MNLIIDINALVKLVGSMHYFDDPGISLLSTNGEKQMALKTSSLLFYYFSVKIGNAVRVDLHSCESNYENTNLQM